MRLGLTLEIVGILGLAQVIAPDTKGWQLASCLALYGFGVGLATAQLPGLVLRDVPEKQSGQASGTETTGQQIGSIVGVAVLGTVLFSLLTTGFTDQLHDVSTMPESAKAEVIKAVTDSAGGAIGSLGSQPGGAELQAAAEAAFSDATQVVAGTAAAFLLLGLGATVTLPPTRRKTSKVRGPRRALPPPDDVLSEEPAELDNPAGLAA